MDLTRPIRSGLPGHAPGSRAAAGRPAPLPRHAAVCGPASCLERRAVQPSAPTRPARAGSRPRFPICGIPYYISGEVAHWRNLAHRTIADLQRPGRPRQGRRRASAPLDGRHLRCHAHPRACLTGWRRHHRASVPTAGWPRRQGRDSAPGVRSPWTGACGPTFLTCSLPGTASSPTTGWQVRPTCHSAPLPTSRAGSPDRHCRRRHLPRHEHRRGQRPRSVLHPATWQPMGSSPAQCPGLDPAHPGAVTTAEDCVPCINTKVTRAAVGGGAWCRAAARHETAVTAVRGTYRRLSSR